MKAMFFATSAEFRKWLEKNHDTSSELLVGFYKKGSGKPSVTWPESVGDERLGVLIVDSMAGRRLAGFSKRHEADHGFITGRSATR